MTDDELGQHGVRERVLLFHFLSTYVAYVQSGPSVNSIGSFCFEFVVLSGIHQKLCFLRGGRKLCLCGRELIDGRGHRVVQDEWTEAGEISAQPAAGRIFILYF